MFFVLRYITTYICSSGDCKSFIYVKDPSGNYNVDDFHIIRKKLHASLCSYEAIYSRVILL